jgi:membrane protein
VSDKSGDPRPLPDSRGLEDGDRTLRDLWAATERSVRARWDTPIERATQITRRAIAWFPIRVWRHFLQHNGFLLAAGISYQSLFAIFGVIYLSFAIVGLWLGGSQRAIEQLIDLINRYIPGIISDNGLVKPSQVAAVASESGSLLTITGIVAGVVVIWTAIGFITYARRAVRDTFGLPFDRRNYVLLKARDLLAAVLFGLALVIGAALGAVTTGAVDLILSLLGSDLDSTWTSVLTRLSSILVAFVVNSAALAAMFHFLTGTSLTWRRIWPGAILGGAAMVVLQIGAGFLFVYTPTNPLLATFAIFIGFLLWFRLNGIVILVSAAWIAVAATDSDETLQSEADIEAMEHAALLLAAQVRLREARAQLAAAPWYARWWRRRAARAAERGVDAARAAAPPAIGSPWQFD